MTKLVPWGYSLLVLTGIGCPVSYRAMKMTARGLSVTNADVELIPGAKGCIVSHHSGPQNSAGYENCYGPQPLRLGLDLLRHLRLYFATEEHVLYFTAADAGMPPAAGEVKLQSQ